MIQRCSIYNLISKNYEGHSPRPALLQVCSFYLCVNLWEPTQTIINGMTILLYECRVGTHPYLNASLDRA
jgi:hypothetical protein